MLAIFSLYLIEIYYYRKLMACYDEMSGQLKKVTFSSSDTLTHDIDV